jgi:hypothetical protein
MSEAFRVVITVLACAALILGLVALVRRAGSGSKAMRTAGMVMALFGWGHMRDPRNDTVAEARDGRTRAGSESGDPPG